MFPKTATGRSAQQALDGLRKQLDRWHGAAVARWETVSSGWGELDALLPDRGIRRGTFVEWIAAAEGSGAETLALLAAREACREGGALVVVDPLRQFYPPAAARWGIDLARTVVVQTTNRADCFWAIDQSLRCAGVAAVVAQIPVVDGRYFRRFQLAAEQAGTLGVFTRPKSARHEPSWADIRWVVEPLCCSRFALSGPSAKRWVRVHLLRARGATGNRSVVLELGDETYPGVVDSPAIGSTGTADPVLHRAETA